MSEQANVASGAAEVSMDTGAATPTAPAGPLSDGQIWADLESKYDAAQAPASNEANATSDESSIPEGEPAPEEEEVPAEAKADEAEPEAKPEETTPEPDEWAKGTPLEKFTPEQKAFLKANPQLKDAVYRDRAYHENGVTVKLAEVIGQSGLTTVENVAHAVQAVGAIEALDADFKAGTPDAAIRLANGLAEESPEAALALLRNLTTPDVLLKVAPDVYFESQQRLLQTVFANTRAKVQEFLQNDPDAVAAIDGFQSLLEEISRRAGTSPPNGRGAADPVTVSKLQELEALKQREVRSFGDTAAREINDGVKGLIGEALSAATPKGFDPQVKADLVEKIRTQLEQRLTSDVFFRRERDAILRDTSRSLDDRRAALVKHVVSAAKSRLGKVVKDIVTPYTRHVISGNRQQHERRASNAQNKEIGASAPAKPSVQKIDYRTMSDDQIYDSLMQRQANLGR